MPLLPAKVLDRKLVWTDFVKTEMSPPGPFVPQISAQTVSFVTGSQMGCNPVKNTKPTIYKTTSSTVTVTFDKTSWVASYVLDSWSQQKQDDLLAHEQAHFIITACTGRDFQAELEALGTKEYTAPADGIADITAIMAKYDRVALQAIQDKYDLDTKSSPTANAAIQAKWTNAVEDARANNKQLHPTLKTAGLVP